MAEQQDQDRSEKATPSKRREARRQGQVAKSTELTAWIIMLAAAALFYSFGVALIEQGLQLARALLSQSGAIRLSEQNAVHLYGQSVLYLLGSFWYVPVAIAATGLLANFVQIGPVFSGKPLQVDFKRINPAAGFKRLFNKKILFELAKVLLKIAVVGATVWLFLQQRLALLLSLPHADAHTLAALLLRETLALVFYLLAATALIALLDFAFVKWEYTRNLRMSRRDIKEEVKRQDGDPQIKAKIRELQRQALSRAASLKRVPDADVIITNPTHLSVAIRYVHGKMAAPMVIAKGAGELALKMRSAAALHRVPLVENRPLARRLFERVPIDQMIVPETYAQVAAILTKIYQRREQP